mmetsp:Transcript_42567/g.141589  ORF Transcript_42567/g.141589 Transcript_42567/m.141589 type:complete len:207 (+) Transcript_42567:79-699(+)
MAPAAPPAAPSYRRFVVGTKNACKIAGLRAALEEVGPEGRVLSLVGSVAVEGLAVPSGISDQPMTVEETAIGAENRARAAFATAEASGGDGRVLSFGIESGVYVVGGRVYDTCCCCAFDGEHIAVGWSCAFEIPPKVASFLTSTDPDLRAPDLTVACNKAGLAADPKLGESIGCIGVLSRGRLTREEYTTQAKSPSCLLCGAPPRG